MGDRGMESTDRLLMIAATAGIWMILIGEILRPPGGPVIGSEEIAQGVKAALNDCRVQGDGRFICR